MSGLFVVLIVIAVALVWFFCGTLVREVMRRRCHSRDQRGARICEEVYLGDGDAHLCGVILGYLFGPVFLLFVYAYELADGTTKRRVKAWRKVRRDAKQQRS